MIKFPNPSFRKYTYPRSTLLRLNSNNPLLSSQEYILYGYHNEYTQEYDKGRNLYPCHPEG